MEGVLKKNNIIFIFNWYLILLNCTIWFTVETLNWYSYNFLFFKSHCTCIYTTLKPIKSSLRAVYVSLMTYVVFQLGLSMKTIAIIGISKRGNAPFCPLLVTTDLPTVLVQTVSTNPIDSRWPGGCFTETTKPRSLFVSFHIWTRTMFVFLTLMTLKIIGHLNKTILKTRTI